MTDRCRICRFWKLDLRSGEKDVGEHVDPGFGWCRRRPPVIVEHIARMAIQSPVFGGGQVDRDDVAPCSRVEDASLFPATFGSSWCGEFRPRDVEMPLC